MSDRAAPPACSADEIEVTPEMIEAGVGVLVRFSRERDLIEDCAEDVFRAMEVCRRQRAP